MIVFLEAQGTNAYNRWTIQSEFLGIINLTLFKRQNNSISV